MNQVKVKCPGVKWLSHYLVLGPHDFLDLYEAANEEEAAKVAMISLSLDALSADTGCCLPLTALSNSPKKCEVIVRSRTRLA